MFDAIKTIGGRAGFLGFVLCTAPLLIQPTPSHAALIINPGYSGSISAGNGNDVINTTFGVETFTGYFGSTISQAGLTDLQYDLLGFEAGYANKYRSFDPTGGVFRTEDFAPDNNVAASSIAAPLGSFTSAGVNGVLDFRFSVNGGASGVSNEGNPWNTLWAWFGFAVPNFFANQLEDGSVVLWLDDAGAGPDRDYDDMVIRISEVVPTPLPPALPLFLVGVASLAWWRRKQRSQGAG